MAAKERPPPTPPLPRDFRGEVLHTPRALRHPESLLSLGPHPRKPCGPALSPAPAAVRPDFMKTVWPALALLLLCATQQPEAAPAERLVRQLSLAGCGAGAGQRWVRHDSGNQAKDYRIQLAGSAAQGDGARADADPGDLHVGGE